MSSIQALPLRELQLCVGVLCAVRDGAGVEVATRREIMEREERYKKKKKKKSLVTVSRQCHLPLKRIHGGAGAWVAQSIKHPTSVQAMTSRFVALSPASGFLPSAQSPLGLLCLPLSLRPSPACAHL